MAKGSRGGKNKGGGGDSPFGNEKPYVLETYYRQKQGYYGQTALEASHEGGGVLNVDYNKNAEWENTKSNEKGVKYTINHGFYTSTSGKDVYDHNINWDNVKVVKGQTFKLRPLMIEKGFKWNREKKQWEK